MRLKFTAGIALVAMMTFAVGCGDDDDPDNDNQAPINQGSDAGGTDTDNNGGPANTNQIDRPGHHNNVEGLAWDGEYLYTGSDDTTVRKIDPGSEPERVWTYEGHADSVRVLAVDDEGYLYSGSQDTELHKIDPAGDSPDVIWTFDAPGGVSALTFDDDGILFVSAGASLLKIDPTGSTPEELWDEPYIGMGLQSANSLVVGPEGYLYAGEGSGVDGGGELHKIDPDGDEPEQIWALEDDEEEWGIYRVRALVIDDDGYLYAGSDDSRDLTGDDSDERVIHKIDPSGEEPEQIWAFEDQPGNVTSLALDGDGNLIGGSHGTSMEGGYVYELAIDDEPTTNWTYTGHEYWVQEVLVTDDGDVYGSDYVGAVHRLQRSGGDVEHIWTY